MSILFRTIDEDVLALNVKGCRTISDCSSNGQIRTGRNSGYFNCKYSPYNNWYQNGSNALWMWNYHDAIYNAGWGDMRRSMFGNTEDVYVTPIYNKVLGYLQNYTCMGLTINAAQAQYGRGQYYNICFHDWMGGFGTNASGSRHLIGDQYLQNCYSHFVNCKFINCNTMRRDWGLYSWAADSTMINHQINFDNCLFINSKFGQTLRRLYNCTVINTKFGQQGQGPYTDTEDFTLPGGVVNTFMDQDSVIVWETMNYNESRGSFSHASYAAEHIPFQNSVIKGRICTLRYTEYSSVNSNGTNRTEYNSRNEKFSSTTYYRIWDFRPSNASRASDFTDFKTGHTKLFQMQTGVVDFDNRGYEHSAVDIKNYVGAGINMDTKLLDYRIGDNDAGNGQDLTKLFNLSDSGKRQLPTMKYRTWLQEGVDGDATKSTATWAGAIYDAGSDFTQTWVKTLSATTYYVYPTTDYTLKEGSPLAHAGVGGLHIGYKGISYKGLASDTALFPSLTGMTRSGGSFVFDVSYTGDVGYVESKTVNLAGTTKIKICKHENAVTSQGFLGKWNYSHGPGSMTYAIGTAPYYRSHSNNNYHNHANPNVKYKSYCTTWNPQQVLTNPYFQASKGGWSGSAETVNCVQATSGHTRGMKLDDFDAGLRGGGFRGGAYDYTDGNVYNSRYIIQAGCFISGKTYVLHYHADSQNASKYFPTLYHPTMHYEGGQYWNNLTWNGWNFYNNYHDFAPLDIKMTILSGQTDMKMDIYYEQNAATYKFVKAYRYDDIVGGKHQFEMKYGSSSAAVNSASWKKFLFGVTSSVDGSGRGNGDMDYDADTGVAISPKYIKIKLTFYKDHPHSLSKGIYNIMEK